MATGVALCALLTGCGSSAPRSSAAARPAGATPMTAAPTVLTTPAVLPATSTGAAPAPSVSDASPTPGTGYPVGPWATAVCQALTPLSNDAQAAASTTAPASTVAEARTKIIDLYTTLAADVDSGACRARG